MKKIGLTTNLTKSFLGLIVALFVALSFSSCEKKKLKNTPWYIYEHYIKYPSSAITIPVGSSGLDHKLDFKNDGTIYYYMESVPSAAPAYWGSYTSNTVTLGSGGAGSVIYNITNQTSTLLEASYTDSNGMTHILTLKK